MAQHKDRTPANTLSTAQYNKLKKEIGALLSQGQQEAQKAVTRIVANTYWHVGKRLKEASLSPHAGYKKHILETLGDELNLDRHTLGRAVRLYTQYPKGLPSEQLSWSHYKELLTLPSDEARTWYAQKIDAEHWTLRQLRASMKARKFESEGPQGYGEGRAAKPSAKKTSQRRKSSLKLKRPTESTYVYKGQVLRVVDGDTLDVRVDLGFDVYRKQRLRLAHLDTPPLKSPEGKAARDFVLCRLAQVSFVMVRTNKHDTYGRFVADVFYQPGEPDKDKVFETGRYLNQELLRAAHAVPYV